MFICLVWTAFKQRVRFAVLNNNNYNKNSIIEDNNSSSNNNNSNCHRTVPQHTHHLLHSRQRRRHCQHRHTYRFTRSPPAEQKKKKMSVSQVEWSVLHITSIFLRSFICSVL